MFHLLTADSRPRFANDKRLFICFAYNLNVYHRTCRSKFDFQQAGTGAALPNPRIGVSFGYYRLNTELLMFAFAGCLLGLDSPIFASSYSGDITGYASIVQQMLL